MPTGGATAEQPGAATPYVVKVRRPWPRGLPSFVKKYHDSGNILHGYSG
jgi:hypothetical protein